MPERRSRCPNSSVALPVASAPRYEPVFAEGAASRISQLPRRRQHQIALLAQQLARHPFLRSDYTLPDDSGRPIEHLLLGDFVFSYWLDHAAQEIRIVDVEDAS